MKYHYTLLLTLILFLTAPLLSKAQDSDSERLRSQAQMAVQKVDDDGKWLALLTPADLNELPVGLKRTINNVTYKLAVSSAVVHQNYSELTVFARVDIPQNPKSLFFGVSGLKLSHTGSIIGNAKLTLLGNVPISMAGGNAQLVLKGDFSIENGQTAADLTYITMDCEGFKEMGIAADVVFPRSMIIPCDANGDKILDETKKVMGSFQTRVTDWNNMLVSINLPKFQVNALEGFVFDVTNATFDFSDTRNTPDLIFPNGYEYRHMTYPNPQMWRGVFIQSAEITLPKAFQRKGGQRVSFGTTNFILDNNGITGLLFAKNILPYNEGSASGWKFSVDEFRVGLEANQLIAAGFKGCIGLPVAEKDSLRYEAMITGDNNYQLLVSPKGTLDFQLWQAKVTLNANSYVKLRVEKDQFRPEANLYGRFDILPTMGADSNQPIGSFKGITFRGLRLRTTEPYLAVDYLGYDGEVKLAGFPVSIDKIALVTTSNNANLAFNLNVTLQDKLFKGTTRLNIHARFENNNGHHRYQFEKVRVSAIELKDVKVSGVLTLSGSVAFMDNDPIYGQGFGGGIQAKFNGLGGVDVKVRCIFGHSTFRYWFIDGKADLGGEGFPIAGVLKIQGLAGGAYYRMSKTGPSALMDNQMPNYKPDANVGLGIKAGIVYSVITSSTVKGVAEFETAFNKDGGIKYIGLFGNARFMPKANSDNDASKALAQAENSESKQLEGLTDEAKLSQLESIQNKKLSNPSAAGKSITLDDLSGISGYMGMLYDFNNKSFHANFEVYVNVGGGFLQGVGDRYRAGQAVMHFDPNEWYIHLGTPTDPIGVKISLGRTQLKTEAYFMLGSKIPGSPPPPQEVANVLGVDLQSLNYMSSLNSGGTGKGIAFGAHLRLETGDITFLMLYANLKAGIGFDLMLKQYGNTSCKGRSGPIGINGWYANAQAYAYVQGEIGIKVNLWFIKARIPVMTGSAAVLLQAQLPNPSWFEGHIGLNVSVLGGLVSGRMHFKLTLGDKCELVMENPNPVGIDVISDFSPSQTNQVDVFTAPQVTFNFPIDKDFEIDTEHGKKTYRAVMENFELHNLSKANAVIPSKIAWNNAKDAATLYSSDILPPLSKIKATVKVSFKELKGGTWQTVYMHGKKSEETREINLTTGTAPETIPLSNIDYSWPVVYQHNFYRAENNYQGVIQLKRGQPYLFDLPGYEQELVFEKETGGTPTIIPFSYNAKNSQLSFNVDALNADTSYELLLVSKPADSTPVTGPATITQEVLNKDGNNLSITKLKAQSEKRDDLGKTILTYSFRSSTFDTFHQKMESNKAVKSLWRKNSSDVISLQQQVLATEPFDIPELKGTAYTAYKPLVQPYAILDDKYFTEDIYPIVYKNYPVAGSIHIAHRDTTALGFLPIKALPVMNSYLGLIEQENLNDFTVKNNLPYLYDLPRIYKEDFSDLQNQVVNRFLGKPERENYNWLIHGSYPMIRHGNYKVNYQYVLPGGIKGTSYVVEYYNNIE